MRSSALLLTLGLATAPALLAQRTPGLAEGQPLRISAPGVVQGRVQATFIAWQGDTLVLRGAQHRGDTVGRIPIRAIERLEAGYRRPRGAGALRGLWIGFVTGALFGGSVGFLVGDDDDEFDKKQTAGLFAALAAGAGVVIGPLVGVASPGYRWTTVEVPPRVTIVPLSTGVVALTVSLRTP